MHAWKPLRLFWFCSFYSLQMSGKILACHKICYTALYNCFLRDLKSFTSNFTRCIDFKLLSKRLVKKGEQIKCELQKIDFQHQLYLAYTTDQSKHCRAVQWLDSFPCNEKQLLLKLRQTRQKQPQQKLPQRFSTQCSLPSMSGQLSLNLGIALKRYLPFPCHQEIFLKLNK